MDKRRNKLVNNTPAETLEERTMLSGTALTQLAGDTLIIRGSDNSDQIDLTQDGDSLSANVNGETQTFQGVNRVVAQGRDGDDSIVAKLTDVELIGQGGDGNDEVLIVSSQVDNFIMGGDGDDLVSSTGQGSDIIQGGDGQDRLYGIVGDPNVVLGEDGSDKIISRNGVEITDTNDEDIDVSFRFDRPTVGLRDGVLYLMGSNANDTYGTFEVGDRLFVVASNQNGFSIQQFDTNKVDQVAGILLGGNDRLVNLTDIGSVFYGASGSDFLFGGDDNDVLKGGSGNDVVFGRGGDDFVTGDAGQDVLFGGDGNDFILPDQDDLFVNFGDGDEDERDYVDVVFSDPSFLLN